MNTALSITSISINGINAHVASISQCNSNTKSNCCSKENLVDQDSVCFIQKIYPKFSGTAADGIINLEPSSICQINGLIIQNFYAVLNYISFLYNGNQNSTIVLANFYMTNSFFQKGLFYFLAESLLPLSFSVQNMSITDWNLLQVEIPFNGAKILNVVDSGTSFFFFYNVDNPIILVNLRFQNCIIDYFLLMGFVNLSLSSLNITVFNGILFKIFSGSTFYLSNSAILNSTTSDYVIYSAIELNRVSNYNTIYFQNVNFNNSYGYFSYFYRSLAFFDGVYIDNVTYPYFEEGKASIIYMTESSILNLKNIQISNIINSANTLIQISFGFNTLIMKDSLFTNITFLEGVVYVISYNNASLDNVTFSHTNCTKALFASAIERSFFTLNNSYIYNITAKSLGPFIFVTSSNNKVKFLNSKIERIISGTFFSLTIALPGISYYLSNVTFENIFFKSGVMFIALENHNFTYLNCTFRNIFFETSVYLNELFDVSSAYVQFINCLFYNIAILEGDGYLIHASNSTVLFENNSLDSIFIQGNGGLGFSSQSTVTIRNTNMTNITKNEQGIIQTSDCIFVLLENSIFRDIKSFQYTLLNVKNVAGLIVQNCLFHNITANFESSVISISSKDYPEAIFYIKNNEFEYNSAKLSFGGNIVLYECSSSIIIKDNIFKDGYSKSGALIYAANIFSLKINNCTFMNSIAAQQAGVLSLTEGKFIIENCSFLNNSVNNGIAGNIFVENSNISIFDCLFDSKGQNSDSIYLQGSFFYSVYTKITEKYFIYVNNTVIQNMKQNSDVIYISAPSSFVIINLTNILFDNEVSLTQNGIMTINGNFLFLENITVQNMNMMKSGNMFEFTGQNQNGQFSMRNLSLFNNLIKNNGNFFKIITVGLIQMNNIRLINSQFEGVYFFFQNLVSTNSSINDCNISNNSNYLNNGENQIFVYAMQGNFLAINKILINDSNSSLFYLDSVTSISIQNIDANNLQNTQNNLIFISNNINCFIKDVDLSDSSNSYISISSDNLELKKINFNRILASSEIFLIFSSKIDGTKLFLLDSLSFLNFNKGIIFQNLDYVNITNSVFNNEKLAFSIKNALIFQSIANLQIQDSIISNFSNSRAIQILTSNTKSLIKISNVSIISCGGGDIIQIGGGVYVLGYFDIMITDSNFVNNTATSRGNILFFSSENPLSDIVLNENTFQKNHSKTNSDIAIFIPNETFYSKFIQASQNLLISQNLSFSSYTNSIKFFGKNQKELKEGDSFGIYSGQAFDLELVAYNYFNETTTNSDKWLVEISQVNSQFEMRNFRSIFVGSSAFISQMQIFVPYSFLKGDLKLSMLGKIIKTDNFINKTFDLNFFILVNPCDKGRTLISDKCVQCSSDSFSLENNPSLTTICLSCPENSKCYYGTTIVPDPGYWSYNLESSLIIKCELEKVSCNFTLENQNSTQKCKNGYFGNVCNECVENYGKTLLKSCVSCEDNYLGTHILRTVIKWIVLAGISIVHYWLFVEIMERKDNMNSHNKYDLFKVFLYHFEVYAIIIFLQTKENEYFWDFNEVQSVFTFFENNLFLIYCVLPNVRDFKLVIAVFIYILLILVVQFLFALFFIFLGDIFQTKILKKPKENIFKYELKTLFSLIFANNYITFFFYFIGLVFYLNIGNGIMVSIFFRELTSGSGEFFIVLFCVVLFILIFMGLNWFLVYKNIKMENFINFLGFGFEKNKLFFISDYICLFFMILFAHYGIVSQDLSRIAKNIFMIYLGVIISFRIKKIATGIILPFKIFSCIVLIVSFYDFHVATIILNSIFGGGIICYFIFLIAFPGSEKAKRVKSI